MINYLYILASLSLFHTALGAVAFQPSHDQNRTFPFDIVQRDLSSEEILSIANKTHFAIELPRSSRTTIDASRGPDGTRVFYSHDSETNSQYKLPEGFFRTSAVSKQGGKGNKGFVQFTACIDLDNAPQLNPSDKGGVYENQEAGLNGDMNFGGSRCEGFSYFVECVQPKNKQFVLRCCNDKEDCPVPTGNQRCSDAMRGDYGSCAEDRK